MSVQAPPPRRLLLTSPGEKLLVPAVFDSAKTLDYMAFHDFETTGSIKKKLDGEVTEWASPKVVYATLVNGESFWVDIRDERKFHCGCALVNTTRFGDDAGHPKGYSGDPNDTANEREMRKLKIEVEPGVTGAPVLKRYDTYGTVWLRRRYTLQGDDTYSFIQWMDSKESKLKEKPVTSRLTDVAGQVKSLEESYRALKHDVSDMKVLLQNYSTLADASLALAQSLQEMLKEQKSANASLSEQMSKLRRDLCGET